MEEKTMNRQTIIDLANQAIASRMPAYLMEDVFKAARKYGKQHGKSNLVEDWIKEGDTTFATNKHAQQWANTLP